MDDDASLPALPASETVPDGALEHPAALPDASSETPRRIGPYTITGLLGTGGMGVVYRAEQQRPLRRVVALKLIRRGLDTDRLVARFEAERSALARMNHSGIARVFDAGATEDGRPYFVMELVDGRPLIEYCDAQRLTVRDRLALFVGVCRAVQHAHQKGIVHRDLKPSNLLVTANEGTPTTKVIDFGVAKAMAESDDEASLLTRVGQVVGTPEYMSPEQAGAIAADVDTRTDVYALGVVLYELLAGRPPDRFTNVGPDGMPRTLRARPAVRPSTAVGASALGPLTSARTMGHAQRAAIATARRTTPERLARLLAGDLDTIVLKAMAYEPARRYPSVDQLAEDVERYLAARPVQARPDSWWYRTRKFIGRHRFAVAGASAALGALLVFSAVTALQSARVARERDRAEQALARAEAVNRFLVGMFQQADPRQALGEALTAEQMLARAATRLQADLQDAPLVRAQLLQSLADVYKQLGRYELSERLTIDAVQLRRGDDPLVLADSLDALGDVRRYGGRTEQAVAPLEEALALRRGLLGTQHRDVAETTNNLALVRHAQGRFAEAEALHRQALTIWEEAGAREDGEDLVALGLTNLGRSVRAQGRSGEAAALFERALRLRRARLAPSNPRIATSLYFLALTRVDAGRIDDAATLLGEALRLRATALGEAHPQTLQARVQLARVLLRRGEGVAAAREAEATLHAADTNPNVGDGVVAEAELVLGRVALGAGRPAEARTRLARVRGLTTGERGSSAALRQDVAALERALQVAR